MTTRLLQRLAIAILGTPLAVACVDADLPAVQPTVAPEKSAPAPSALDLAAMQAWDRLTAASAASAHAIWPGYGLHSVPVYLVERGANRKGTRGYVRGLALPPAGALRVAAPGLAPGWRRFDGWKDYLKPYEDSDAFAEIAGENLLAIGYDAVSLAHEADWAEAIGVAYFDRLRMHEAAWVPLAMCIWPNQWSPDPEALALMFAECQVLAAAAKASEPAVMEQGLRDFAVLRSRSLKIESMVTRMYNGGENEAGSAHFATRRLLLAANLVPGPEYACGDKVLEPWTTPMAAFQDVMQRRSAHTGAVLLDLADRLGWKYEPTFRGGGSVFDLIGEKLGEPGAGALAQALQRVDWVACQQKAAEALAAHP